MQSDWLNSALSPVVYGDIALSINTQYKMGAKWPPIRDVLKEDHNTAAKRNTLQKKKFK